MDIIFNDDNDDDNNHNDIVNSLNNYIYDRITKIRIYQDMEENINRILNYTGNDISEFKLLLEVNGLPECITILTGFDYYEHYHEMLSWQDIFEETEDDRISIQHVINDIRLAIADL